jgi:hypothetical protein
MADINEDTPLLRRFSIPTVFTQPGCFEQMSDKTNFEEEYNTPACTYDLSLFSAPLPSCDWFDLNHHLTLSYTSPILPCHPYCTHHQLILNYSLVPWKHI